MLRRGWGGKWGGKPRGNRGTWCALLAYADDVKLPNGDRAVVELAKLLEYCLDPTHPRGRHKARVFAAGPGITQVGAPGLRAALLDAARSSEAAVLGRADGFGTRYTLDFLMSGPKSGATVRSAWIIRAGEDFPRFTSCYVL